MELENVLVLDFETTCKTLPPPGNASKAGG
jgi:hypothetical protein